MTRTFILVLSAASIIAGCVGAGIAFEIAARQQSIGSSSNSTSSSNVVRKTEQDAQDTSQSRDEDSESTSSRNASTPSVNAKPVASNPAPSGVEPSTAQQRRQSPYDANGNYNRFGIPMWEINEEFKHDVFRFVRVKYNSWGGRQYHQLGRWATDFPDSDLNFSYRLQQLTSIKVDPEPLALEITDERLFDYPFLYMIEPGTLYFTEPELIILRRYLLNGGFLMVDDFWGESEWDNFEREILRVFPDREIKDLPLSHKIFHYVYDLKEKPQVPSIHHWQRYGDTSERGWDSEEVHYRAIEDDNGRIMVMICHNTDLGDGWEREGESRQYFELFSEKHAYPLGINIVLYAMTQ